MNGFNMNRPEILAPAGDEESLSAALAAGADAVYFGLDEGLNARARATNFSLAELNATVRRIHRAGAKAYVTLNTLVFEKELPLLEKVLRGCAAAGVDALIVQDPAVALLSKQIAPSMDVHASTQMTISSAEGAAFAQSLGISRIVLPRELSLEEIRKIKSQTTLELEVFVHGALCMSWSGQCLTSEAWGGRSANRGQCAQSCRLPYSLLVDGVKRPLGDVEYLLSPLDLSAVRAIGTLAEIGVKSLKIEGRLKGPQYVKTAVETFKTWRDAIAEKLENTPEAQQQLKANVGNMAVSYSRGFSNGFFFGSDHQHLVEGRFPKHRGALLGEVVEVRGNRVRIKTAKRISSGGAALSSSPAESVDVGIHEVEMELPTLMAGCGVGFDLGTPQENEPGGPIFKVEEAPHGHWLTFGQPGPDLSRVSKGNKVWLSSHPHLKKQSDTAVEEGARGVLGRIPVTCEISGTVGMPLKVQLTATGAIGKNSTVSAQSSEPLTASTGSGLSQELLVDKLCAFGSTPFYLAEFNLNNLENQLHLPVSQLKTLRRQLTEILEEKVLSQSAHEIHPVKTVAPISFSQVEKKMASLIPLVRTMEQLEAVIELKLPIVELDFMELVGLEKALFRARHAGLQVGIATTRVQKPGEEGIDARFLKLKPDFFLVRHWGGLMFFSRLKENRLPVHADFSLNVTNSVAANELMKLGCESLTASHDLDEVQLKELLHHFPASQMTVVAHHHISTFHTEHCVYSHVLSHGKDFRTCGRPCEKHKIALEDPKGFQHPVVVDVGCRNTVFNAQAQSIAGSIPGLLKLGVTRFRAEFVWETKAETLAVLSSMQGLLNGTISVSEATKNVNAIEQFGVTQGTMRTLESTPRKAERATS
jgi:U32 family peptidase